MAALVAGFWCGHVLVPPVPVLVQDLQMIEFSVGLEGLRGWEKARPVAAQFFFAPLLQYFMAVKGLTAVLPNGV